MALVLELLCLCFGFCLQPWPPPPSPEPCAAGLLTAHPETPPLSPLLSYAWSLSPSHFPPRASVPCPMTKAKFPFFWQLAFPGAQTNRSLSPDSLPVPWPERSSSLLTDSVALKEKGFLLFSHLFPHHTHPFVPQLLWGGECSCWGTAATQSPTGIPLFPAGSFLAVEFVSEPSLP